MLDNARAPSTGDEAVGPAYLRLIFPYNMYISYSDITLHVEEPGYEEYGQEEDWTQNQGQMSSSGSYPNMYTNWDFGFTSTEYHNGDWEAGCTYHWKRYNMMLQVIEEGDASVDGYEFVVNNLVVTDAYDLATSSRNFIVNQEGGAPIMRVAIAAHPYGDSRDTITYRVYLRTLAASPSTLGPWTFTDTLAGPTDSANLTLDDNEAGNPEAPARGVYAFDVEAVAYTAYTSGHWCDGLPEVDPDTVEVYVVSAGNTDSTAIVDSTYDVATADATATNLEFYGPTASTTDILLRNTIDGGDPELGANEKELMSLTIGASDTHYLGVAVLDENTERYRSHTARWSWATGWQAPVPSANLVRGYDKAGQASAGDLQDTVQSDAYLHLGRVACDTAPSYWLFRGSWLAHTGGADFCGDAQYSSISHDELRAAMESSAVFSYAGHGVATGLEPAASDVLTPGELSTNTNLQLGVLLSCYSDVFEGWFTQECPQAAFIVTDGDTNTGYLSFFSVFFWSYALGWDPADVDWDLAPLTIQDAFDEAEADADALAERGRPDYHTEYPGCLICGGEADHILDPALHFDAPVFQ